MRYFLLIAILLLGVTGFAQNKTASISTGNTYLDLNFTAADTINESQTYWILVNNFQDYPAMQDVIFTGSAVSGTGNVVVTVYGKKFSAGSYSSLGTVTWDASADTTYTISITTANRYRYWKIEFASDATNKQVLLTDVEFKNWFTGGQLSSTSITDGTATLSSGALSGATTGAFSGAVTVGGSLGITGYTTANKIAIDGLRASDTSGYEYWLDVQGDITSTGTAYNGAKTFGINSSMTRAAGVNTANGDMEDALIKGTITNRAIANAASYIVRGINVTAMNRDGNASQDDVNWLEGAYISAKNQTANTGTAEMRGVYARVDLDPSTTATTETGALKAELDLDANAPSISYGVQSYYQSAGSYTKPVAAFWVNAGTSDFWQYGLKLEAGKVTTDISLQNGETLSNSTDGVIDFGTANLRSATYNFASATAVGGTADAITIDFTPDFPALVAGLTVTFIAESANTGAATLAIDGGTAKNIYESSDISALEANDIRSGAVVTLVYDGTQWQQISQSGN